MVSCDPEVLDYHQATAEPPKIKFATCLTLERVEFKRLTDEAFWAVLWFTSTSDDTGKLSPLQMFYGLLLSFLCDDSLEQAMLRSHGDVSASVLQSFSAKCQVLCAMCYVLKCQVLCAMCASAKYRLCTCT